MRQPNTSFSCFLSKVYVLVSATNIDLRRKNQHAEWLLPPRSFPFACYILIFPLNYLRALRDWPTNLVGLNNLPIIRGLLCFIRRVSNKSHCVFRRAASNSIRVRTRTLSTYPEKKKAKWRNGRGSDRRDREGNDCSTIRTNWLEIRLNIANLWRSCKATQYPHLSPLGITSITKIMRELSLIFNNLAIHREYFK